MSDGAAEREVVNPVVVGEDIEERRAKRDLMHWVIKSVVIGFMIIVIASVFSLIYAAIIQEKDLDTAFIGELFKGFFDFIRFLLS